MLTFRGVVDYQVPQVSYTLKCEHKLDRGLNLEWSFRRDVGGVDRGMNHQIDDIMTWIHWRFVRVYSPTIGKPYSLGSWAFEEKVDYRLIIIIVERTYWASNAYPFNDALIVWENVREILQRSSLLFSFICNFQVLL